MSTGTLFYNGMEVLEFINTIEILSIFMKQFHCLVHQFCKWYNFSTTKIEQPLINTIAVSTPPIFSDQEIVITTPALIAAPETEKHSQPAEIECTNGQGI